MKSKAELISFLDELIAEGYRIGLDTEVILQSSLTREHPATYFYPRIMTLFGLLGANADPWRYAVAAPPADELPKTTERLVGVLKAIREAIDRGLLTRIESIALAEAHGGLLDQAKHLIASNYALAAGVLGRAVVEEHLRQACVRAGCLPLGQPTINDLNMALYKDQILTKTEMLEVQSLAGKGNHCAHNIQPPLSKLEASKLIDDVQHFLAAHPLP